MSNPPHNALDPNRDPYGSLERLRVEISTVLCHNIYATLKEKLGFMRNLTRNFNKNFLSLTLGKQLHFTLNPVSKCLKRKVFAGYLFDFNHANKAEYRTCGHWRTWKTIFRIITISELKQNRRA